MRGTEFSLWRRRRLVFVNLLIVLTLVLPGLFVDVPYAAESSQALATTADSGPAGADAPELAGKRAKIKRDRRKKDRRQHERRRDKQGDRGDQGQEGAQGDRVRRPSQPLRSLSAQSQPPAEESRVTAEQEGTLTIVEGSDQRCEELQAKEEQGLTEGPVLCTDGPEGPPPGVDASQPVPLISEAAALEQIKTESIACVTSPDGLTTSGFRTRVLYVRAADKPDLYQASIPTIQTALATIDLNFRTNSYYTGALRNVRFWQDPNTCLPYIESVVVSSTGDDSYSNAVNELFDLGFNRTDRIYLVFLENAIAGLCGQGSRDHDDSPGVDNRSNTGPAYALVYKGCWDWRTPTHELMHNLGAVQESATYSTHGGGHCLDEYEIMCYSDGPGVQTFVRCADPAYRVSLLDCGRDDYFNTNPAPGSYLANFWNPSTNRFLTTAAFPPPPPPVVSPPPPTSGWTGGAKHKKRHKKPKHHKKHKKH